MPTPPNNLPLKRMPPGDRLLLTGQLWNLLIDRIEWMQAEVQRLGSLRVEPPLQLSNGPSGLALTMNGSPAVYRFVVDHVALDSGVPTNVLLCRRRHSLSPGNDGATLIAVRSLYAHYDGDVIYATIPAGGTDATNPEDNNNVVVWQEVVTLDRGPVVVKVTTAASGGGKYNGRVLRSLAGNVAAAGNLAATELGTDPGADNALVLNMPEVTLATHDLTDAGNTNQHYFLGEILWRNTTNGRYVVAINGFWFKDCTTAS